MPEVSIGMPVCNGARLLERALTSLLQQSFRDVELIISDDASTDATGELCRRFARSDGRVRYLRHGRNIGAADNYLYVLAQARAPYFMWATQDDVWEAEYIAANYAVLRARPDVVLSVSRMAWIDHHGQPVDGTPLGTYPLMGSSQQNLKRFLSDPEQNARYYGLLRTDVLRQCTQGVRPMWADDRLVMARTLAFGKHFEVERCLLWRSPPGDGADERAAIARLYRSRILRAMPLLPCAAAVLTDPLIGRSPKLLRPLIQWNTHDAGQLLSRCAERARGVWQRLKRPLVKSRRRRDPMCDPETVRVVQQLLAEPLISDRPRVEQFTQPGAQIDCNRLLDIADDGRFVEAAYRQVLGREIPDRTRRKWLWRLAYVSRAGMLARLRYSVRGRAHAARLPGLRYALLLDQPRRGWLRLPLIAAPLTRVRRSLVERCSDAALDTSDGRIYPDRPMQMDRLISQERRKAS